jgi:gliding motility-associated protein GldM
MAGGKETPRQKMIGMMYLVLTALLALNVSKAILDAFVAIEANTQKSSITHLDRGNAAKSELAGELADRSNPEKIQKVKYYLGIIDEIDKETAKRIEEIDALKMLLLEKSGEDVKKIADKNKETIVWKAYDKKNPLTPAKLWLQAVQAKDQYDVPMEVMIGEELKSPKGKGLELWNSYNEFRLKITGLLGSYKVGGKTYTFKPTAINEYKEDNLVLGKAVDAMIAKNKINVNDDAEVLKQLYMELTKPQTVEMEEGMVHWIGKTFDHSPLVAAIASLTAMQQEILSARATAIAHIKSRVSTGEYSFNKVVALAYGPALANSGDEVEVKVMMAAYDSDNQPEVTGPGSISVADGQGIVKLKVSGGNEMKVSGTVAIKKKSGAIKKENWTHTIKIMKPEGTVTLPEMNVLYRGYKNLVTGVASGYDQTVLTGTSNVTLSKTGTTWIGSPGAGATAVITVSGKSSITNKTVALGKFEFRVKALPKPSIFVGAVASGGKISTNPGGLNAGYPPEIPLKAQFSVLDWEASVTGIMGKKKGQGSSLQGIGSLLGQAKPGSMVIIEAGVRGPDGKVNRIYETFKL